jgi:hypothetical protein
MADELELHYLVQGTPDTVMAQWRQDAPEALHDFEIADESFNSIVYERYYYDWPWKIMFVMSLGFMLLFRSFMRSWYRVTVRFDADGGTRTKVTLLGIVNPQTRAGLGRLATQSGGSVGLSVGV